MSNPSTSRASTKSKYRYPVYRSDDRPRQFISAVLEKTIKVMNEDELWEELRKLHESED